MAVTVKKMEQPGAAPAAGADGEFQSKQVVLVSAGHALHDTYTAFLPSLIPLFLERYAMSRAGAGLLITFIRFPSIFQPFFGRLADRGGLRYIVILGPALTAILMSLLGLAPNTIVLAVFLMLAGFSSAGFHAVGPVVAGNLSGSRLGRGMGFWMVGGEFGRVLGPLVIVTALQYVTLPQTAWLMVLGIIASGILFLRLRDVPIAATAAIKQEQDWHPVLKSMIPVMLPLFGITLFSSMARGSLGTYLPTFLMEEGSGLWFAGASLSLMEAAGVVGALVGGSISDRFGRRNIILLSQVAVPLFMLIFLNVTGLVRFGVLLLLGFSSLSVSPVYLAVIQESFPENRSFANGVYMAVTFLISSVGVVIVGFLGDRLGMNQAYAISAGMMMLGVPCVFFLPRRSKIESA